MEPETGWPNVNRAFDMLSLECYASASLASAYGEDWDTLKYLCNSACADKTIESKVRTDSLNLTRIAKN